MIHNLPSPKTFKKAKIVGRGSGTGKGAHTTGRGNKGQKSRSGYTAPRQGFEGGQNPIYKRLPKFKGFSRGYFKSRINNQVVKLSNIENAFDEKDVVTKETIIEKGLLNTRKNKTLEIKIVFDKEISKKLNISGLKATKKSVEAIEKAGGSVK